MDDERPMNEAADEPLRDLAVMGYNTPDGRVPREEMWANIAAARRAARVAPLAHVELSDHVSTPVIPLHRRQRTIWRWSAALAAGLVLGVAVDRALVRGTTPTEKQVADVGANPPSVAMPQPAPLSGSGTGAAFPASPSISATEPSDRTPSGQPGVPIDASRGIPDKAPREAAARAPRGMEPSTDPSDLYRAAAVQTLMQAEALLTAYRTGGDAAPDPQSMQQAARWARDVLSSTRLLMDSPAARDPRMRVLFTDLELVLAQIVQLSGAPLQAPERELIERALIERALRDRDLLPRLRSAVPAGLAAS